MSSIWAGCFTLAFVLSSSVTSAAQALHCSERSLPPTAVAAGAFGTSVALDGGNLAVSRLTPGSGPGVVHLFRLVPPDASWQETQVVNDTQAAKRIAFGASVAMTELSLLVTDPLFESTNGFVRGRVHAFQRGSSQGTFGLVQRFNAPVGGSVEFGTNIEITGDRALISAPATNFFHPQPSIFVFERDPVLGTWSSIQELLPLSATLPSDFGASGMDQADGLLAVGDAAAPLGLGGSIASGRCYLYRQDPVSLDWVGEATLLSPTPEQGGRFGRPAVISATSVAVIAEFETDGMGSSASGRVHIYDRDAMGVWSLSQTLSADAVLPAGSPTGLDSIAADGDLIVVGQAGYDATAVDQGRALVFRRDGAGVWSAEAPLDEGVVGEMGDRLGAALAVDSERVVVVAPGRVQMGGQEGLGFALDLSPADCDGNLVQDSCEIANGQALDRNLDQIADRCQDIGVPFCLPGVPNSSGAVASLGGLASMAIGPNELMVCGSGISSNSFGFLLGSSSQGVTVMPGNSVGDLCLSLGPDFGRFVDQIINSDSFGVACTLVDFNAIPTGMGTQVLAPGDTWNFQYWFRDGFVSNFTNAIEVTVP